MGIITANLRLGNRFKGLTVGSKTRGFSLVDPTALCVQPTDTESR